MKLEVFLFILIETIIIKCDTADSYCGKLEVIEPGLLGRNVTLRFTPTPGTYLTNGQVTWSITWNSNSRKLTGSRYITSTSDNSYLVTIVNSTRTDEQKYIAYYADRNCYSNRVDLYQLLTELTGCGLLYLRSKRIRRGDNVEISFFPAEDVKNFNIGYVLYWLHGTTRITINNIDFIETNLTNDEYVLTIKSVDETNNGQYQVQCTDRPSPKNISTSAVEVEVLVPPDQPILWPTKDIAGCKKCLFAEENQAFTSFCNTSGGSEPVTRSISVNGKQIFTKQKSPGIYTARFKVLPSDHLAPVKCQVKNDAIDQPIETNITLYVIRSPKRAPTLIVPELKKGQPLNITCTSINTRPAPKLTMYVAAEHISSSSQTDWYDPSTKGCFSILQLNTMEREWHGQKIQCCLSGENFLKKFSSSHTLNYMFPPTDVELTVSDAPSEAQAHYQINASCTAHKANPMCNVTWSVTGGTETHVSFSKLSGEWIQGFTITSNVTLNVPGKATQAIVTCSASCTQFNAIQRSHRVLLPGHKEDTEKSSGETSSMMGPVVGAVVGLLLVIIAVVVIIVILRRKKETKREQEQRPLNNQSMPQQANAPPIDEQDAMYAQIDKSTKTKHSPVEENKDSNLVYVELDVDHLAATASGGTKATHADDEPTEYSGIDFVKTAHASNEEAVYANE